MADVTVQKRGEVYQYKFEIASIDGKRKFKNKSGFATKSEAKQAGIIAYNEYLNTGHSFKPKTMSYSDYLDYWMKEHCEINLKYHTIEAYKNKMRIEYLISQLKEILAYKKGLNRDIYPDIPNPLYTGVTNGEITSGISIKHGNIVFYKENGEEITREDIDNEFYNHAVNIVKRDIRKQNENDETELVEVQSDNKKYLVLKSQTLRCTDKKSLKLVSNQSNNLL